MFQQYDISRPENFFDVYPVDLDRQRFLANESWGDKIDALTSVELKRVFDIYGRDLSDDMIARLGARYYAARLGQPTTGSTSGLRHMIAAITATKNAGFELAITGKGSP